MVTESRRVDVLVEMFQRVVAGEAAVVQRQDRAADGSEAQRLVDHQSAAPAARAAQVAACDRRSPAPQERRRVIRRPIPARLRRRLLRASYSRQDGERLCGIRSARSARARTPRWRNESARDFPSDVGAKCIAPYETAVDITRSTDGARRCLAPSSFNRAWSSWPRSVRICAA